MGPYNLLQLSPLIGRDSYGLGPVILNLAVSQSIRDVKPHIWSLDEAHETERLESTHGLPKGTVTTFVRFGPKRLALSPRMERAVITCSSEFDILHQHGIWTGISRVTSKWRRYTGRPTVISPHGSMASWAINRSRWKKSLALAAYEGYNLRNASCLHALSSQEAREMRAFGLRNPIAVIPNGISDTWLRAKGDGPSFRRRHGITETAWMMFFLGRITPKKGLPLLLRALASCQRDLRESILVIGGDDEFAHKRELITLIRNLGIERHVHFAGPLYDQEKSDGFAAADLFVLPSLSEGAPISILEALGAGVPVLTTKASPWKDLETNQCGWWTDISEASLAAALADAARRPREELAEMGERGRSLVAREYRWENIAQKMTSVYRWLMKQSGIPDFVEMN